MGLIHFTCLPMLNGIPGSKTRRVVQCTVRACRADLKGDPQWPKKLEGEWTENSTSLSIYYKFVTFKKASGRPFWPLDGVRVKCVSTKRFVSACKS